jgi:hypothetical protein
MSQSLKKAKMKSFLIFVLTLAILAACDSNCFSSTTAPFTLTLEAEQNPAKANSEVKVDITLSNSSNRAMHMSYDLTGATTLLRCAIARTECRRKLSSHEIQREEGTSRMTTSFTCSQVRASQKLYLC